MKNEKIPTQLLTKLRKVLHKHPELSGHETETASRIAGFLKNYTPNSIIENIGGTGVAAVYQYYGTSPTIVVRCELDALPIKEINTFEHKSKNENVSHKCGHDGHMVMVAGLASLLNRNRKRNGRVVLLFQPAEENGEGAVAVLKDKKFTELKPDYIFALHNLPGFAKHEIVCKPGTFNAAVISMNLFLDGKTSHAAEPENGINPSLAIAEILNESQKLIVSPNEDNFALVTPIQIEMGEEAYGISAGHGIVRLTLRTWDNKTMNHLKTNCEKLVTKICKKYKLKLRIEWTQSFASCQNNADMEKIVQVAANENKLVYTKKERPFKWGEDFGLFTEKYKGAMFGLGSGEKTPALHNPDYDFPDEIIPSGIKMFNSIINQLLK